MGEANRVSYEKEFHERAKREGCHLVTLDIHGKYAKADGVTGQCYVHDKADVDYLWAVFQWLHSGRYKGQKPPAIPAPGAA
jgi:hypothetical protein